MASGLRPEFLAAYKARDPNEKPRKYPILKRDTCNDCVHSPRGVCILHWDYKKREVVQECDLGKFDFMMDHEILRYPVRWRP